MKAIINGKATLAALGILAVTALAACGKPGGTRSEPKSVRASNVSAEEVVARPAMVCVLVDFSASIAHYGVEIPKVSDLMPIVDVIDHAGGELAIGTIQENPTTPLRRLRIAPPKRGLEPPGSNTDVFTRRKLQRAYEKALPEFDERERLRREANRQQISEYIEHLESYLQRGATARATDLWGNVRRCDTFLREDVAYWTDNGGAKPARYLLIISDGRHNVDSSSLPDIDRTVTVTGVSGARGLGNLSEIKRLRWFESVGSAVWFITTQIERNTK